MTRLSKLGLVLLVAFLLLVALGGLMVLVRGTPVHMVLAEGDRDGPPPVADSLFAHTMELYTGTHMEPGNRVEELRNGDGFYPRLWADIDGARTTVTVQMYYSQPGRVADAMQQRLIAAARRKVRVKLLLDAFGSQNLSDEWRDALRAAGVELAELRPLRWYVFQAATNRSHARAVIVDGRIGYTGGFGLADYWLGNGRTKGQWRETSVRFEGPAVSQLQAAFAIAWAESTGELLTGDLYFPRDVARAAPGTSNAGLLYTAPTQGSTNAERFLALSIAAARRTLYITNSYFVPDDDFRRLLTRARRRGVDVRVLTVGNETDVKSTLWAGRWRYEELLRAGVRVYEYRPTMMHAKTMVVDGTWGTIGSMNFDNRSLAFNNETNLVVLDAAVGARMDSTFLEDLRYADEIVLERWLKRGWWERTRELGASLLSRVL
ncbi:MAG TPA: phospholipase D-like domain-containing protein [Gemmatimonadaceae bacterium]|nr:phospholipase D-like domain-containing protein [Gemmatimonadaceae bacterium]